MVKIWDPRVAHTGSTEHRTVTETVFESKLTLNNATLQTFRAHTERLVKMDEGSNIFIDNVIWSTRSMSMLLMVL